MRANFGALSRRQRSAIALLFSFLALSFAIEAKMAMYEPASGPGFTVRSARATPAEARDPDAGEFSLLLPSHDAVAGFLVVVLIAIWSIPTAERIRELRLLLAQTALITGPELPPQILFRPPPSL